MKKIEFSTDILKINNIEQVTQDIQEFVKDYVLNRFKKKGVVVGISGGIDSAVTLALCVRALGPDKVLGIIMPEKESNPKSKYYAEILAKKFSVRTEHVELTPILDSFNVYQIRDSIIRRNFSQFDRSCKYRLVVLPNLLERDRLSISYLEVLDGQGNVHKIKLSLQDYSTLVAATTIKIRARMITLYFHAEKNNYLVVGTTNKSEFVQGYYVKYGDGGVDLDPLTNLYKTQVYQLAEYLRIPEEIIQRKPSPDTWSFEVSDEEFFFSLPYETIDLLWYAKENNVPLEQIEKALNLTQEQIKRVFNDQERKWKTSKYMREMPPSWSVNTS